MSIPPERPARRNPHVRKVGWLTGDSYCAQCGRSQPWPCPQSKEYWRSRSWRRSTIAGMAASMDDANKQLGPYVEGMLIGLIDWGRAERVGIGWKIDLQELDRHALVFTSPSGLRWRIVAELVEDKP